MRSNEKRISLLHERAEQLRKERDLRTLRASGGISCALIIALSVSLSIFRSGQAGYAGSNFTGASLLSEGTGMYVIVGIVSFMLGVVITVIFKRYAADRDKLSQDKTERPGLLYDETLFMVAGGTGEEDKEEPPDDKTGKST